MNNNVLIEIEKLRIDYGLIIPKEFAEFISNVNKFEYAGVEIQIEQLQFEFNSFIVCENDELYNSLLKWYVLNNDELSEYLVFAFGGYNDSFAIKAKGANIGKIYHIEFNEDKKIIKNICESFNRFIEILKENR